MTRRITGAEARELAAGAASYGPFSATAMSPEFDAKVIDARGATVAHCVLTHDAHLLAAAPDLAESLAAVEAERDAMAARLAAADAFRESVATLAQATLDAHAERDALRAKVVAYGQAHDARTAHSKRIDNGAELWFAERDELNNAVSDALAALREAAK